MPYDLVELLFSKLFKQIHVYFKETSCGFFLQQSTACAILLRLLVCRRWSWPTERVWCRVEMVSSSIGKDRSRSEICSITWEGWTRQQPRSAWLHGCTVGVFIFCSKAADRLLCDTCQAVSRRIPNAEPKSSLSLNMSHRGWYSQFLPKFFITWQRSDFFHNNCIFQERRILFASPNSGDHFAQLHFPWQHNGVVLYYWSFLDGFFSFVSDILLRDGKPRVYSWTFRFLLWKSPTGASEIIPHNFKIGGSILAKYSPSPNCNQK